MKKLSIFTLILFLGCLALVGCTKENEKATDQQPEVTMHTDASTDIENLQECTTNFFTDENGNKTDCNNFPSNKENRVCSYFIKEMPDGSRELKKLKYINACFACQFYGENGIFDFEDYKYYHIGYTGLPCQETE